MSPVLSMSSVNVSFCHSYDDTATDWSHPCFSGSRHDASIHAGGYARMACDSSEGRLGRNGLFARIHENAGTQRFKLLKMFNYGQSIR